MKWTLFEHYTFACSYETKDFDQVEEELVNRETKLKIEIGSSRKKIDLYMFNDIEAEFHPSLKYPLQPIQLNLLLSDPTSVSNLTLVMTNSSSTWWKKPFTWYTVRLYYISYRLWSLLWLWSLRDCGSIWLYNISLTHIRP